MKEEIRRIMKLVQEGKLSPEDAAELIDAFQSSEEDRESPPPPPPDAPTPPDKPGAKDPMRSFVDFVEGIGREVSESVDWHNVAHQIRAGAQRGVESMKVGIEQVRQGKVNWGWFSSTETRTVELPLVVPEGKSLRIENPSGDVRITGGNDKGVVVASARIRGMDADEAHEKAEAYTIIVEESDHQILIRQPDVSGLSVDLNVTVAGTCPVEVRTLSGDLHVENTGAGIRVDTHSGDVRLKGLNGPIEVRSQSGDLAIEDAQTPSATVEVKSGDIRFTRLVGNLIARSASGDVNLEEGGGKSISIESVTGDVQMDLIEPISGSVSVRTVNGNASVKVADGSDCRVSLSTLRGHVHCDLSLEDEARQDARVTGKMGDGTGTLDVSAVNGDISVRQRDHQIKE